eukprot:gnl/MRDRNA2_/MRDRNA2_60489_c0_seq1.p1 gnl/MRDRNA2_/MRDRNA2_60489_c0~~gnl/MRDRNA2_/MRDRNA2_60489_c0_seq1.p1  ORF type:complete len:303 (-),score=56.49 gnl/MRDRNA2_/MRDRNA2_60489_c0_seq1:550-1458(-)
MATESHITMSAAVTIAPIVLWSDNCAGNLYLARKNTFLEFYTDEKKAMKRSAQPRSASADSHFKSDRSMQSTATPTHRSESPSNHSIVSSDDAYAQQDQVCYTDLNSPGSVASTRASWCDLDTDCEGTGYPTSLEPWPMPPCVNESLQEMQPQVVKPRQSKCQAVNHAKAAKKQDLKKFNKGAVSKDTATTLMVRGIPCSFSQETLLAVIDDAGFTGKYDFFYLPRDEKKRSSLGYAFINFVDQESADLCTSTFTGLPLAPGRSLKTCMISPADIQGLPALWKHFRRTAVSRGSNGPMFLKV